MLNTVALKLQKSTSVGLTYIHTCRSYVHTPRDILQTCLYFKNGASLAWRFASAHLYGDVYMRVGVARALTDSSDFGLLGEQSLQKFVIPWFGRRWSAEQNVTPLLALSSAEKSVSVQTNQKSKRYMHILPIGMRK